MSLTSFGERLRMPNVPINILFVPVSEFLSDCNWTRAHNHLVHKRTLNHLAKLAK